MTYVEALATFMYGISPGGGSSNFVAMYTGSNLELSVSLSILSNILSFALMPLWLLTWPLIAPVTVENQGMDIFSVNTYKLYDTTASIPENNHQRGNTVHRVAENSRFTCWSFVSWLDSEILF